MSSRHVNGHFTDGIASVSPETSHFTPRDIHRSPAPFRPGPILNGLTVAARGVFGLSPSLSHATIRSCVEANGGIWSADVSTEVTHLICSKAEWKDGLELKVSRTRQRPRLVLLDWLVDTLRLKQPRPPKPYHPRKYRILHKLQDLHNNHHQNLKRRLRTARREYAKGRAMAREDIFSDSHHIHRDPTSFAYNITLVRPSRTLNRNDLWHVRLYESDSPPHNYACVAVRDDACLRRPSGPRLSRATDRILNTHRLPSLTLPEALNSFATFFHRTTNHPWDLRIFGRLASLDPAPHVGRGEDETRKQREEHRILRLKNLMRRWGIPLGWNDRPKALHGARACDVDCEHGGFWLRGVDDLVPAERARNSDGKGEPDVDGEDCTGEDERSRFFRYTLPDMRSGAPAGTMCSRLLEEARDTLGQVVKPGTGPARVVLGGGRVHVD